MATTRFEKKFALKEATETFLFLMEGFDPSIFCLEIYGDVVIELRAQVLTKEEKLQFIKTAKSITTKGIEVECYYHRAIRKYCIEIRWRLEK